MIYQLIGAPGTDKERIANDLRCFLNEGECENCFKIVVEPEREDLGFLADYRSEIHLATTRAINTVGKDQNLIAKHSLLDSVAYVGLHVKDLLEEDQNNQDAIRWMSVFNVALQMLIDGKQPDRRLYIPYEGEDQNSIDLDEALQDILVTLELDYTEIDPSEEAAKWISS